MKRLYYILFLMLVMLNYNLQAQINVNGNIYIADGDSVYVAPNTNLGFDTLYIGQSGSLNTYFHCDDNTNLYVRGGLNIYGEGIVPGKLDTPIKMSPTSNINLVNLDGNNKTFLINIQKDIEFIQNLYFIDTLEELRTKNNVYLASSENQIKVLNWFKFSNKWPQTVTLKPLKDSLDLYVNNMDKGTDKSYIVTMDTTTTLSRTVSDSQTFYVGSGINPDSFFSPVKIIALRGNGVVKVASLPIQTKYQIIQGGEREEYVNNVWFIKADPTLTEASVGLQHNPVLDIGSVRTNDVYYYYPNDTATIIRYVGFFPNFVGSDTSFSNWETLKWGDVQAKTLIADSKNNTSFMIWSDAIHQYMQRNNITDFDKYHYFVKARYADDKAPLTGNPNLGATFENGHLTVPEYLEVIPSITGSSEITLNFKVKNEYRIYQYEIYRNDINDPTFDGTGNASMVLAGTIDADALHNFDSGRYVHSYKFVDDGISSVNNTTSFYYQIRPIGGTGRGLKFSEINKAGYTNTKKLTILGNPVSRMQGVIKYRFISADYPYASLRVALVNSAGTLINVENIPEGQTQFYESDFYFSTKHLAAGVYLLVAQGTKDDGKVEVFTARIIVE